MVASSCVACDIMRFIEGAASLFGGWKILLSSDYCYWIIFADISASDVVQPVS